MYTLYEFYDKKNNLIYIGITDNFPRRLSQHSKDKHWYKLISTISLFYFNSRGELEEEEKARIENNLPLFNRIYNTDNIEQAVIEYCIDILSPAFIFENKKLMMYDMFEWREIELHTLHYKLFEIVEQVIADISWNSPQFKRVAGEVLKGIKGPNSRGDY